MPKRTIVDVECRCGQALARYEKKEQGHLVKMYLMHILLDKAGVFLVKPPLSTGAEVFCPKCNKRVAVLSMIHGQPAAKINQGQVKPVNT